MTKDIDDILPKGFGEMPDGRMWHPMDEENRQLRAERDALKLKVERLVKACDAYDRAVGEAEAILGGEYAMHHGVFFDLQSRARDLREADAAIKEAEKS